MKIKKLILLILFQLSSICILLCNIIYIFSHHNISNKIILLIILISIFAILINRFLRNFNDYLKLINSLINSSQKDSLTGFYNKKATEILIDQYLHGNKTNTIHALFILDIDDFKNINDNYGHVFGDDVLKKLSLDIQSCLIDDFIIGRIGGDEFAIFLKHMNSIDSILLKANEILSTFNKSFTKADINFSISASIGVSVYPQDGISFNQLYKNADSALYRSKKSGKNKCTLYKKTSQNN